MSLQVIELLISCVYVIFLNFIAYGCGVFVIKKFWSKLDIKSKLLPLALGWGAMGFAIYILGILQILNIWSITTAVSIFVVMGFIGILNRIKNYQEQPKKVIKKDWTIAVISVIILVFGIFLLISASGPDIKFDGLWYHLTQIKFYLMEGGIRAFMPPAQLGQSSVTPRLIDLFYTYGLVYFRSSSVVPKLIHLSLGLGAVIGLIELGAIKFNRRVGYLAGLILITTPVFAWLAQTAYIDLGVVFFAVATFIAYELWVKDSQYGLLFGVLLGLLLSTKLWVLLLLPILIIDRLIAKVKTIEIIKIFGLALLILSPWLIEAYVATGNPVYPLFSSQVDAAHLAGASSLKEFFVSVYPKTWHPLMQHVFLETIPWLSLIILGIFYLKSLKSVWWKTLRLGVVMLLAWTIIPVRDERYMLAFIVPLIICAAAVIDKLLSNRLTAIATVLPSLGLLVLLGVAPLQRAVFYLPEVRAEQSTHNFLVENVSKNIWGCYDTKSILRDKTDSNHKVLVFCHNMFYLNFSFADGFDIISKNKFSSVDDMLNYLQTNNFNYLLTKRPAYTINNLFETAKLDRPAKDWVDAHFELIYSSDLDNTDIYQIK